MPHEEVTSTDSRRRNNSTLTHTYDTDSNSGAIVRLHMMGHYAEPPLDVILNATDSPHALFHVTYNPMTGEWKQRKLTDDQPDMEEDGKGEKEKEREHSGKGKEKEKEKEDEDEGMMVIEVIS